MKNLANLNTKMLYSNFSIRRNYEFCKIGHIISVIIKWPLTKTIDDSVTMD